MEDEVEDIESTEDKESNIPQRVRRNRYDSTSDFGENTETKEQAWKQVRNLNYRKLSVEQKYFFKV